MSPFMLHGSVFFRTRGVGSLKGRGGWRWMPRLGAGLGGRLIFYARGGASFVRIGSGVP